MGKRAILGYLSLKLILFFDKVILIIFIGKLKFSIDTKIRQSPEKTTKSPIKITTVSDPEDLELKLEVDKLNDIRNIMYLKGKIITDTKKTLPMRTDFQKLMKEK